MTYTLTKPSILDVGFRVIGETSSSFYSKANELCAYEDEGLKYIYRDDESGVAIYHYSSGATIWLDDNDDSFDSVLITGTEDAIREAQEGLELLTERRLEEVFRE